MQMIAEFLSGSSPWVYSFIFLGKLIEVALASLRQRLIVKGQRLPGAFIALIKEMLFSSDPNVVITVQAAQQVKGATMADTIKK